MTRNLSQTMVETNPGTVLAGKYRVERVLGTGGMGVVVAALHEQLDERVAIKLLRADRLAQKDAVERALREARAAVKIQSDHVVRVFDVGTLENGSPYIVMEYLAGCDLAQLLCAEGKLDVADACSYVRQACDAVAKAHAIGIVHRDLKPANMFLAVRDDKSAIKVLDFGISKLVSTDPHRVNPALTSTESVLGSPAYMSPEQLDSPRDIDGRTDVWSLGVILFELLTGAHPFVADTLPQLYKKIADEPAPSVRSIRPDVPVDLDAIVARCLAKKASERFADVTTLARALGPFAVDATDDRKMVGLAETAAASREEIESARLASQQVSASAGAGEVIARPNGAVTGDPQKLAASTRARRNRRRLVWSGLAAAGLAAAATSSLVCVRADSNHRSAKGTNAAGGIAASPLNASGSVLACPPLVVKGVDEPAGWLGAAASTIACTRAMARMGGHSARSMIPAELLDLPRTLVDNFPSDVFADPKARDKAVTAAKARGQAWLDGEISHDGDELTVQLVLRAAGSDREIARGTGKDKTLVGAIRTAMAPLDAMIPAARDDDPHLRDWFGVRTASAAAAIVEWSIQARLEWPAKAECTSLLANPDVLPIAHRAISLWCAPNAPPSEDRDTSTPGALAMSIEADGEMSKRTLSEEVARIDTQLATLTDHDQRAVLLGVKADVYSAHHEYAAATQSALNAIAESPDAFTPWTGAWNVLAWIRSNSNAAPASLAWTPWNVEAYCFSAMDDGNAMYGSMFMKRNTLLSHNPVWRQALAQFLVNEGKGQEATSVVASLGGDPMEAFTAAGEGHLTSALRIGHEYMKSKDAYIAFSAAEVVSEIDMMLGRKTPEMDDLVKRMVEVPNSPIAHDLVNQINAAIACTNAPPDVAKRCFAKLREFTSGYVAFDAAVLPGAEKYAQGDYKGAALAWRPLVAKPDWHFAFMHNMLAIAFDHAGDPVNASRIDARYVAHGATYNGAEPAHAREALRAEKRGDVATARSLAKKVIDAWSVVDMDVPAVKEMRALVARLDKKEKLATSH
jgi:serine/threonine-protein kinase